jgi:hypothetical protein
MTNRTHNYNLKQSVQMHILEVARRNFVQTYRQHLWWSGYIHNLTCTEDIKMLSDSETAFSVFKRNFHTCETNNRYLYDYEDSYPRTKI